LGAGAHAHGWVVAEGGSQAIADALAADIVRHGGTIETGVHVRSAGQLPPHELLMLDVSPSVALDILGDRLPPRVASAYRRYRHGPGAFKVDFAVEGGVPWAAEVARRAGTVHLGGTAEEVAAAELGVHRGAMPERPFVLVGQQYLADPGRSVGNVHPVWTYAHVPAGYTGDATEAIVTQIERFAPGFRQRVVGTAVRSATDMAVYNPNYVGGDIIGGAASFVQTIFRPRVAVDPYATGIAGTYLCSASTPPGAGAHGMCGANAADRALAALELRPR
jgi:phytoene dehydrogenase-like protein